MKTRKGYDAGKKGRREAEKRRIKVASTREKEVKQESEDATGRSRKTKATDKELGEKRRGEKAEKRLR